jgi:hypothetical protein
LKKRKPVSKSRKTRVSKPYVIVRTYSAGVHVGTLESRTGREVVLSGAKRIWAWKGANTLHEISLRGVAAGSRVSDAVGSITLTEAIEIIPTTSEARSSLESAKWNQ